MIGEEIIDGKIPLQNGGEMSFKKFLLDNFKNEKGEKPIDVKLSFVRNKNVETLS